MILVDHFCCCFHLSSDWIFWGFHLPSVHIDSFVALLFKFQSIFSLFGLCSLCLLCRTSSIFLKFFFSINSLLFSFFGRRFSDSGCEDNYGERLP